MDDNTSFADMINMVYEYYGLDKGYVNIKLSYMLRKKSLMKLTHDTPPDKIGNFRQFQGFFRLLKLEQVCLRDEVTFKGNTKTMKQRTHEENVSQSDCNPNEDADTDKQRFAYYDDSDGATSDDDFISYILTLEVDK